MNMKKHAICVFSAVLFLASAVFFAGCSGKKDFSAEQSILGGWGNTLKNRDYAGYRAFEAYPRASEQFSEMYRDYYISNITVIDVSKPSGMRNSAEGKSFISKTVTFGADIIMRKDNSRIPASGTVDLLNFSDNSGRWLISGKTIIRSK
ncbi:MAG: hypothetical protein ACRCUT_05245 [Spirochaetota bacterium]